MPDLNGLGPAAQMYTTAEDLGRLHAALWPDAKREPALLRNSTRHELYAPLRADEQWTTFQTPAFTVRFVHDKPTHCHAGGIHGFSSALMLRTDLRLGVVALFNTRTITPAALCREILRIVCPVFERAHAELIKPFASPGLPDNFRALVGHYRTVGGVSVEVRGWPDRLIVVDRGAPPADPGGVLLPQSDGTFRMRGGIVDGEIVRFELNDGRCANHVVLGTYIFRRVPESDV